MEGKKGSSKTHNHHIALSPTSFPIRISSHVFLPNLLRRDLQVRHIIAGSPVQGVQGDMLSAITPERHGNGSLCVIIGWCHGGV